MQAQKNEFALFDCPLACVPDVQINIPSLPTTATVLDPKLPKMTTLLHTAGILFSWCSVLVLAAGQHRCPSRDSIAPCTCNAIEGGASVECRGTEEGAWRIPSVIENLGSSRNLELVLELLTLPVSAGSFSKVSSLHLYHVRLQETSPNSSSFELPKLTEAIIDSSSTTAGGSLLPCFKGARFLTHLEIGNVEMSRMDSEFRESTSPLLTYLDIRKTKTAVLEPHAMSHLKSLQYFIMVDLPLSEFPREALPLLMPHLHTFILGNTKIETLESDFFDGMPKLEVLMLNGNKLKTLDFNLFSPVENQLTHLLAERNPLVCNCNLLWLTENTKKGSMKVLATCKDDITSRQKEVTLLDEDEYCP